MENPGTGMFWEWRMLKTVNSMITKYLYNSKRTLLLTKDDEIT
jgi:hypothetical protein